MRFRGGRIVRSTKRSNITRSKVEVPTKEIKEEIVPPKSRKKRTKKSDMIGSGNIVHTNLDTLKEQMNKTDPREAEKKRKKFIYF